MIKGIDHIAIAVRKIKEVEEFYRETLRLPIDEMMDLPDQGVRIALMHVGELKLELLEPLSESSPLSRFLTKKGPGLHHICFKVDDLQQERERLKRRGDQIVRGVSSLGVGGAKVLFIHPASSGNVLYELMEKI